jgi:phage shock protein A
MTSPQQQPQPIIPEGSVIITPGQMYSEMQQMRSAVEKLANTVDPALANVRRDLADLVAREATDVRDLTTLVQTALSRVTVLETKLLAAWAVIVLLVAAIGSVAAWLGH